MFGISTPHTGKRIAVADIGSGSAGVAILSLHHGKPAQIESAHRTVLPIEERTPEASIAGLKTALSESAEKALAGTKTKGAIHSVYAVIRPPWVRSKTICAAKKFPKDERVSSEVLSGLGSEALEGEKELNHENLIEASIIRFELNGYPTAEPLKKHAHAVTLFTLITECEPRIKDLAEETLTRTFSLKPKLCGGTGVLLSVLRAHSSSHNNYLVVDMTTTATSMFAIQKGTPTHHALVPEGTHTILKRVAGAKMPEETFSMMRMVARDHCEDAACEDVKAQMARTELELIKAFGEGMAHLTAEERLPNTLILLTEPAMADWLSQFFSRIDFTQFTKTAQPFSVETLSSANLNTLAASSDKKDDLGLLIAAAFVPLEVSDRKI